MTSGEVTTIEIRVRELGPARNFYEDIVGLRAVDETDGRVALAGTDGAPPVVTLVETPDAPARAPTEAGLFHLAIRFPDRESLANALRRLDDSGYSLAGASDHQVSEAVYMTDPAGNGVELYCDRPKSQWRRDPSGQVAMTTEQLDLDALWQAGGPETAPRAPAETDLGHVHLEVTDLEGAIDFYSGILGMTVQATRQGAAFVAYADYHHHVGLSTWRRRREPHRPGSVGVAALEATVHGEILSRIRERAELAGVDIDEEGGVLSLSDPDAMAWQLRRED